MINDIERGPLADVLVFHDFQRDLIDIKGWFYYVENWFKKGGLTPNRTGGRVGKNVGFEREKKRLEKEGFRSIQKGIWIGAIPPKVRIEMFDFIFSADLSYSPRGTATMALCWDDQIVKFKREYLETLAKDLFAYLEPTYGYAYQREFRYGPSFYPFGIIGGDNVSREEAAQINTWDNEYNYSDGDYQTGMLRDIYPINFLSKPHLDQKIGNQALQGWIESSPQHGEFHTLIKDKLWSWWIPEDKISAVRKELKPTGLLICA